MKPAERVKLSQKKDNEAGVSNMTFIAIGKRLVNDTTASIIDSFHVYNCA